MTQLTLYDAGGKELATFNAQSTGLAGTSWIVTGYNNGKQAVVSVAAGTELTANFGTDGQLTGCAGCNNYTASYQTDGNNLSIGPTATTRKACEQAVMDQETQYLAALATAATYRIDGNKLELRTADGALAATFQKAAAGSDALSGSSWIVTGYNNGKQAVVSTMAGTDLTADFGTDGNLTGNGGCNTYSATAMILAHRQFDVTVFEANPTVGGRNSALRSDGFTFDTGPTFLMMRFMLHEVFEEAGRNVEDYLKFKSRDPLYCLNFDDRNILVSADHDKMRAQIREHFPGEEKGLDKFLHKERRRYACLVPVIRKDYSTFRSLLSVSLLKALPYASLGRSLFKNLGRYFRDEKLKLSFTFQSKYFGMSPWQCPALFTILPFILLDHFGDQSPAEAPCCCDNCLARATRPVSTGDTAHLEKPQPVALTSGGDVSQLEQPQRVALILLDTVYRLKRHVGRNKLAQILKGSRAVDILKFHYDRNVYYRRLAVYSLGEIEGLIEQLVQQGYLKVVGGKYPVVKLTPQGELALENKHAISLRLPRPVSDERFARKKAEQAAGGTVE